MYPRLLWVDQGRSTVDFPGREPYNITSDRLKTLLLSLKVEVPDDPSKKSIASTILKDCHTKDIVSEINSLSQGIRLFKKREEYFSDKRPGAVCVFETNLGKGVEDFEVYTGSLERKIFHSKDDEITKVILINTEFVGVVDAKLKVYKKYSDAIEKGDIFIQHVYEDFDEMAKLMAYRQVSSCFDYITGITRVLTPFTRQRLQEVIERSVDVTFALENVQNICYREYVYPAGTVGSKPYVCHFTSSIEDIKRNLVTQTLEGIAKSLGKHITDELIHQMKNAIQSELSKELGEIRFDISSNVFDNLHGWVRSIAQFLITIFYPVDVNSAEWRDQVADEIYRKISENKQSISGFAFEEVKDICEKTVQDLNGITKTLVSFRREVIPIDQKQLIKDWSKRDVIGDNAKLREHPTILKYICGRRGDGKQVVKVFLREENQDAELAFEKACTVPMDNIEFVIVSKPSPEKQKIERIRAREMTAPDIDTSYRDSLKQIIQSQSKKIYAQHSNVTGIRISKVSCIGDTIKNEPCIVLYCLDKTLIPFGEKTLPKQLAGLHCDFREDFFMFGICQYCSSPNSPEPGCSIGIPSDNFSGSVGFLYESNATYEFGFFTASHVVIQRFEDFYGNATCFPCFNYLRVSEGHPIVHPSFSDNHNINNQIGYVVKLYFGNFELAETLTGLDFAVVQNTSCIYEEMDDLPVFKENELTFNREVKKFGRTTRTTYGHLFGEIESVKIEKNLFSGTYFILFDLYIVNDIPERPPFFKGGDSGSGVLVVGDPLKALGIAIAYSEITLQTLVCKISKITEKLNLTIKQSKQNEQEKKKSPETGKNSEQEMEWAATSTGLN